MQSGDDLFKAAMKLLGEVEPLTIGRSTESALRKPAINPLRQHARRKAAAAKTLEINPLSGEFINPVEPIEPIAFKRDGVQNHAYRKFRLGKFGLEARLDLHHHTVEMARHVVFEFVRDCVQADVRCVLITHGKGEGRKQPARMKSCVNSWLPQLNEVLAFHSALKQHGGLGATYVLLRNNMPKGFVD